MATTVAKTAGILLAVSSNYVHTVVFSSTSSVYSSRLSIEWGYARSFPVSVQLRTMLGCMLSRPLSGCPGNHMLI